MPLPWFLSEKDSKAEAHVQICSIVKRIGFHYQVRSVRCGGPYFMVSLNLKAIPL